jgi:3-phosphoshikimate 1-carboxyvinyltransferase
MAALTSGRSATVRGSIRVPGDKSISHRALILSALARGKSRITGLLDSADVRSTAGTLRALGAAIPPLSDEVVVTGKARRFLASPWDELDCGNSGTTARLMAGVIAGAGLSAKFVGDASLSRRPMRRIAEPLRQMGAQVHLPASGGLPMVIRSGALQSIVWESQVASAQVKSAILLAATLAGVHAIVREPHLSRDHTERMLRARGVDISTDGLTVMLEPAQVIQPADVAVPSDPSSAAFLVALANLAGAGDLRVESVCLNETRIGFLRVLERMGGVVELDAVNVDEGGETVGTLVARPADLRGIEIAPDDVPSLIDELPLFACVAARAQGESVVRGASELRVKESDRIATVVSNLQRIGVEAEELDDGFRIVGSTRRLSGSVETHGDHRIAMSFGVLSAVSGNEIRVDDADCVGVSYPGFWTDIDRVTA